MMIQAALLLSIAFSAPQAHAWGAASMEARCTSANTYSVLPFSVSQADGFDFDEGAKVTIANNEYDAIVISKAQSKRLKMPGYGFGWDAPNLFTVGSSAGKLGYTIRDKTLVEVSTGDYATVERFDDRGRSLGTERAFCEASAR